MAYVQQTVAWVVSTRNGCLPSQYSNMQQPELRVRNIIQINLLAPELFF
jgi:hypothetical protein